MALVALGPALPAQASAREVYEQFLASQKAATSAGDKDAIAQAAQAVLAQHAALLAEGDGLHYRARLLLAARASWKDVVASYLAHSEAVRDTRLAHDSLVLAAQLVHRPGADWAGAKKLLARVQREQLAEGLRPTYDSLVIWVESDGAQAALIGKLAPDFKPLEVLQGPADLSLRSLRGKVILLEYFATW